MLHIRTASIHDLETLCRIDREAQSHPWTKRQWRDELASPGRVVWVAQESGGEVCGALSVVEVADEVEILNLITRPCFQRRGVASALLRRLLDQAGQAPRCLLEVRRANVPARALYARWGFVEVGRRRNYYVDPVDDALLLTREPEAPVPVVRGGEDPAVDGVGKD